MLKLLFRMSPTPTRSNTRQANDNRPKEKKGGKRDLTEIRQLAQVVVVVVVVVVVPPLPRHRVRLQVSGLLAVVTAGAAGSGGCGDGVTVVVVVVRWWWWWCDGGVRHENPS